MSYTKNEGTFLSSDKHSQISYSICVPQGGNPRAVIQISHGMCEYFDRYKDTIDYFTQKGYIVCGNDHIGHGKSVKDKDDLGYFGSDAYLCLADDLQKLNDIVRTTYRSLPYILIGHSMGSFVARDYISRYGNNIDGVIICGTSGTNKACGIGIFLSSLLSKLRSPKYRSKLMRNMSFKGYNDRFENDDPNAWLSRDKNVRTRYAADPYCSFTFTVNGYNNMLKLLKKVSADNWAPSVPPSLPIFMISGADDPVGNYGKGVMEVYDKLNACEINILKIKLYQNCRHELFNEINRAEVCNDVNEFISEVIDGVLEARGYGR